MHLLADATTDSLMHAVSIGGPICAFIIVVVVACILLYTKILAPEMAASRQSRRDEQAGTAKIAEGFAVSTLNMKEAVERLEQMHERCHDREKNGRF